MKGISLRPGTTLTDMKEASSGGVVAPVACSKGLTEILFQGATCSAQMNNHIDDAITGLRSGIVSRPNAQKICRVSFWIQSISVGLSGFRRSLMRCVALQVLLLEFAVAAFATDNSTAVAYYQREATKRYPELAVKDSRFNALFVARYKALKRSNPNYFSVDNWPLLLADECAQQIPQVLATGGGASKVSASNDTAKAAGSFNQSKVTSAGSVKFGGDVQAPSKTTEKTSGAAKLSNSAAIGILLLIALVALFLIRILGWFFRPILDFLGLSRTVVSADYQADSDNSDAGGHRGQEIDRQERRLRELENNGQQERERNAQDHRRREEETKRLKQQQDWERARNDEQDKRHNQEEERRKKAIGAGVRAFKVTMQLNHRTQGALIYACDQPAAEALAREQFPHAKHRIVRPMS